MKQCLYLLGVLALLSGCAAPAATTSAPPTEPPTEAVTEAVPETIEPTEASTESARSTEPQRVEFESQDGTALVGSYFPAAAESAPGLLLIHQHGANREAWQPLTDALAGADYAILAIDLPGHGESGGSDRSGVQHTAIRSALKYLQELDGVEADRIVLIGASIGADGAADDCVEGCIGVISFSPGNFMGVKYIDALTALKDRDVAVLCLAAKGDSPSPQTCEAGESVGLSDYQFVIYDGADHGNALAAAADITPAPIPLERVKTWLAEHLQ